MTAYLLKDSRFVFYVSASHFPCLLVSICFNPFQPSAAFHIETSHLFCKAKQVTSFYMKHNTGMKWVNLCDSDICEQYSKYSVFRNLTDQKILGPASTANSILHLMTESFKQTVVFKRWREDEHLSPMPYSLPDVFTNNLKRRCKVFGLNSSYSHEEHMKYMNVTCQVVLKLFSRAKTFCFIKPPKMTLLIMYIVLL